jgi:glycosyltransferase involved in cell wall biosynthesis
MDKLISVLMPAYNADRYVAKSIESILNQTHANFELLIIDDCSTDRTWEIISSFAEKDSRVKIIRNQANAGISANRNKLIALSKGKYIAWQDADDISKSYRLEKQLSFLLNNPGVGMVGGYLEFFDGEKSLYVRKYETDDEILKKNMFRQSPMAQPTVMVRKEALEKAGMFDEQLGQAEDLDLAYRIGNRYKWANIPEVLLKYRFHPASISNKNIRDNIRDTLMIRKKAAREYGYKMSITDYAAYAATWSMLFVPQSLVLVLFEKLRK